MTPEQYQAPTPQMPQPAMPQIAEDPETMRRRRMLAMALRNQGQQGKQSTLGLLANGLAQVGGAYLYGKNGGQS